MDTLIFLGLLVAGGVIFQMVGMLWYGPLFGKLWMKATGITKEQTKMTQSQSLKVYGGSFVSATILSLLLYLSVANANLSAGAVAIGVGVGCFVLPGFASLPSYLFEGRSIVAWFIHSLYVSVSCVIVALLYTSVG